jgi:hypothetical protein
MAKSDEKKKTSTMEIRLSVQRSLKENLSKQARTGLLERRSGDDRRGWGSMPAIPFSDSNGISVTNDRRVTPERRVSSMSIDWDAHYSEEAFSSDASLSDVVDKASATDSEDFYEEDLDDNLRHSGVYDIEALQKSLEALDETEESSEEGDERAGTGDNTNKDERS